MPVPWRIPVPVFDHSLAADVFEVSPARLRARDDGNAKGPSMASLIVAIIIVSILGIIATLILIRTMRIRHPNPKYIPTPFLKRIWTDWKVPTARANQAYQPAGGDEEATRLNDRRQAHRREDSSASNPAGDNTSPAADTGVDRNVSVRSVMTLPVYRPKAGENEQVLGREGERDGIDVVVELPTAEAEEALREQEMDALYQIRAARRRQIAEREERRRQRREARDNGNLTALGQLRERARGEAERNVQEIDNLRQEHERLRDNRQRTVSSVSYADLGVARADGTRLRANSTESERIGLLSDAASISQSVHTGAESLYQRRERSASSAALSIDTARSVEPLESPGLAMVNSQFSLVSAGRARSATNSGANTPRFSAVSTRAGSSPEIIDAEDADLGDSAMPPPGYDEVSLEEITPQHSGRNSALSGRNSPYPEPPPDYPGPSQTRNNRLSAHMDDLAAQTTPEDGARRTSPRSSGSIPQLPSLRLSRLPQIVIDPSSARP
ncbi:hypothetical protein B0T16DRAFT_48259 [Cercophora newfieldiana]|uniref:Uncharacterized protein n=1 Tax=Cercophora newfieldiana TaxID=92897 RepID=A0AA40CZ77_9PEZI|nr:hypothetical protein B0T16DRAFT_48259 [Cercophora newfieldiana]